MKINVLQLEFSGIPDSPELLSDDAMAQGRFEELIDQNTDFRLRKDGETAEQFIDAYWDYLQNEGSEDQYTVRWWTLSLDDPQEVTEPINTVLLEVVKEAKTIIYNLQNGLEKRNGTELQQIFDVAIKEAKDADHIGEAKKLLEDNGYLTMGMFHIRDIQGICEQHDNILPELNNEQAKEVLDIVGNKHDASIGINWEVLEHWIEEYVRDNDLRADRTGFYARIEEILKDEHGFTDDDCENKVGLECYDEYFGIDSPEDAAEDIAKSK